MTTDLRDEGERWSLDELRVRQLERLKDTVHRVYANVPHYKKSWDEAGVHPDDIRDDDPMVGEHHLYQFLSYLLEAAVEAVSRG